VRRSEVERAVEEKNPELIIFYDHGRSDSLRGSRKEFIVDLDNMRILKDREVYTHACLSALVLGKEAVKKGCKVYWGLTRLGILSTITPWAFRRHANDGILTKIMEPQRSWDYAFDHAYKVGNNLVPFLFGIGRPLDAAATLHNNNALTVYLREKKREPEGEGRKSRLPRRSRIFSYR
jgi:hypothetical protein